MGCCIQLSLYEWVMLPILIVHRTSSKRLPHSTVLREAYPSSERRLSSAFARQRKKVNYIFALVWEFSLAAKVYAGSKRSFSSSVVRCVCVFVFLFFFAAHPMAQCGKVMAEISCGKKFSL